MAKGKASNIADKIKWLLSISIFSAAIVGNSYYTEVAFLYRVLAVVALFILATIILATTLSVSYTHLTLPTIYSV